MTYVGCISFFLQAEDGIRDLVRSRGLGDVYKRQAQYYLHLGLDLATTSGNLSGQGEIHTNLGKTYRMLGELALSTDSLEQGLRIAESLENRSLMAIARLSLANTKKALGDSEQAATCLLYTSPSPRDRTRSRMPSSA